jgi:hypothetical protein
MSKRNGFLCNACGKVFGGLEGFDTHRVGKFTKEHPHYGRECLDDQALQARGYAPNEHDVWRKPMSEDLYWFVK